MVVDFFGGVRFETGFFCVALAILEPIDQAGLELGNPPASASHVLGLKVCATTAQRALVYKRKIGAYPFLGSY